MLNQNGFTLVELIVVIVILGILSAVAVPKFMDMRTEAAEAAADGVFGAASSAAALNHAAKLVGKAAIDRPAYDASGCTAGLVDSGRCLLNAMDGDPEGWTAGATSISATINSVTYTINIAAEDATNKAVLTKSGW